MTDEQRSAPESGGDYVDAIMEREASLAARVGAAPHRKRSGVVLLGVLLVALAALASWNVYRALHEPDLFTDSEELASAQFMVFLTHQAIEAYRDSARRLPPDLAAIGKDGDPVRYNREGETRYTLAVTVGDTTVSYRSGESIRPYALAFDSLRRGRKP